MRVLLVPLFTLNSGTDSRPTTIRMSAVSLATWLFVSVFWRRACPYRGCWHYTMLHDTWDFFAPSCISTALATINSSNACLDRSGWLLRQRLAASCHSSCFPLFLHADHAAAPFQQASDSSSKLCMPSGFLEQSACRG